MSALDHHRPSDSGPPQICLYDHESWPCTVTQVGSMIAADIEAAIERNPVRGPEWVDGMQSAADYARGPHVD